MSSTRQLGIDTVQEKAMQRPPNSSAVESKQPSKGQDPSAGAKPAAQEQQQEPAAQDRPSEVCVRKRAAELTLEELDTRSSE